MNPLNIHKNPEHQNLYKAIVITTVAIGAIVLIAGAILLCPPAAAALPFIAAFVSPTLLGGALIGAGLIAITASLIFVPKRKDSSELNSEEKNNIVFAGCGPTGLWTAIQTKLRNPDADITMVEKKDNYTRKYVLKLNGKSFKGAVRNPELEQVVHDFKAAKNIRTNEIEGKLKTLALKIGIKVEHYEFTDIPSLKARYPNMKVLVGSGGSRDKVRDIVFGEVEQKEDLCYSIQVKYEITQKARSLNYIRKHFKFEKVHVAKAYENIGKPLNGTIPVTLTCIVTKDTYDSLFPGQPNPAGGFKVEETGGPLKALIEGWWVQKANLGEVRVEGSEEIRKVPLGHYKSAHFVKRTEDGLIVAEVGDAGLGVPFFKSLNNGFLEGTELSKTLAGVETRTLQTYEDFFQDLAKTEIRLAKAKAAFINLRTSVLQLNHDITYFFAGLFESRAKQVRSLSSLEPVVS